jgi:hypothetical protein
MDTTPSTLTVEPVQQAVEPVQQAVEPVQQGREPAPPASTPTPLLPGDDSLRRAHALTLAAGWPLAWIIAVAVEPPSPNHVPLILEVFSLGLMLAMGMLVVTAAARRPAALGWAAATGAGLLFSAIACPVSGHHPGVGAWWFVQMAVIGGMVAATAWVAMDRAKATAADA